MSEKLREKILIKIEKQINALDGATEDLVPDLEPRVRFYKDCKKLFETCILSEIQNAYHILDSCRHGRAYFKFCESIIEDIEEFSND